MERMTAEDEVVLFAVHGWLACGFIDQWRLYHGDAVQAMGEPEDFA